MSIVSVYYLNIFNYIDNSYIKIILWESNIIQKVPEYGYSRYLINHTSYYKMFNECIHNYIYIYSKNVFFIFLFIQNIADISNKLIFLLRF